MSTDARKQSGWRTFAIGMALYAALVVAQGLYLEPASLPIALMVPLALLPMVPAVWAMTGWLEAVRAMDELQRRLHSEAGLISLGLTAVLTFSYGFLEVYLGLPRMSMFVVWMIIAPAFCLGNVIVRRRFR
ncbi:MAG TPA: hypothetical protein VF168_12595 [Trueperaceae bacterium]